jgi:hypothetical protein
LPVLCPVWLVLEAEESLTSWLALCQQALLARLVVATLVRHELGLLPHFHCYSCLLNPVSLIWISEFWACPFHGLLGCELDIFHKNVNFSIFRFCFGQSVIQLGFLFS